MATFGLFTFHDLYGGFPEVYYQRSFASLSSTTTIETLLAPNTTTLNIVESVSTTTATTATTIRASTSHFSKLYKLVQQVPFAYLQWLLIGLAVLLVILLTTAFTCYCRNNCRKNKKTRKEKKQPLPSFYRYRTANRRAHGYNIFETSGPLSIPSPKRPCPPKSAERLNNQLLRQGLDAVGSPYNSRINIDQLKSPKFTDNANSLLTEIKSRLGTQQPPAPPARTQRSYETQRANMALDDESKTNSLLIDMN